MDGEKKEDNQPEPVGWQYKADGQKSSPASLGLGSVQKTARVPSGEGVVNWSASEFVAHHKGVVWYLLLAVAAIVLAGLAYLLTRDYVSAGGILFFAVIFGIAASRKPRVLEYQLNNKGLVIGEKFYMYSDFKSFTVGDEHPFASITFLPLKRFMPPLSIYFPPEEEKQIFDVLSGHLPMEQHRPELVDRLMKQIRF